MKFRLNVRKTKCVDCDVITLVEITSNTTHHLHCPICTGDLENMELEITVAKEDNLFPNPQDLTSICLKCGIDLGNCFCNK